MGDNLNIQFPVDEDGNVANYPTQATFHADPSYINVDETAPENVKEFQEATYNAIQAHARDRGTIEELRILISKRLNGQPITDNQLPLGEPAADVFVKRLRAFTNQEVQTGSIKAQLEKSVGVPLDKILKYCVKCFFTLGSYKKKQKFFQALFHEDFIKQLKNSYVSEEFRDRVTTIRNDVVKEDGTTLTEEERATVSQFLQKILSEITITIWLELDQLLPLLDEQQDSEVVSHITITIDLTGEPKEIQPPTLDAVKKTLSKAISNGNETIRKEFANLIDPVTSGSRVETSAGVQVPTEDHKILSEGHQPGKAEEIIRLVVQKLQDKYDEGSSDLGTRTKVQSEMTGSSQPATSSFTSAKTISTARKRKLEEEELIGEHHDATSPKAPRLGLISGSAVLGTRTEIKSEMTPKSQTETSPVMSNEFSKMKEDIRGLRGAMEQLNQSVKQLTAKLDMAIKHSVLDQAPQSSTTSADALAEDDDLIEKIFLGSGAYGSVYLYANSKNDKRFSGKKLDLGPTDLDDVKKEVTALRREILEMKDHVRIVEPIKFEIKLTWLHLYMKYFDAGTVRNQLDKYGSLDDDTTRKYTTQLLEGLNYLHEKGIIHLDVRGSNMLRDGRGNIKLANFRIPELWHRFRLDKIQSLPKPTDDSGRGYWMAPEVITDSGYGTKADIWSLGATVVEMMTTHPPWYELEGFQAMLRVGNQKKADYVLNPSTSVDAKDFLTLTFKPEDQRPRAEDLLNHRWLKTLQEIKAF